VLGSLLGSLIPPGGGSCTFYPVRFVNDFADRLNSNGIFAEWIGFYQAAKGNPARLVKMPRRSV
jgi:hypothetical protein